METVSDGEHLRTAVYVDNGDLTTGRIMAADFHGGCVDVTYERDLTDMESNILILTALGHTALQTGGIIGASQHAAVNRLAYASNKLASTNAGISKTVSRAVELDVLHVTRPVNVFPELSIREEHVWNAISQGVSDASLARQLSVTERGVRKMNSSLYRKLAVNNKASASLLHKMRPLHIGKTLFTTTLDDPSERQIESFEFQGGEISVEHENTLTPTTNNFFMLRIAGLDNYSIRSQIGSIQQKNMTDEDLETENITLLSKYNSKDIVGVLYTAIQSGHLKLHKECTLPTAPLSNREQSIWNLIATNHPRSVIADILGLKNKNLDYHIHNLYRKLEVRDRLTAALRYFMTHPIDTMLDEKTTYPLRQDPAKRIVL